MTTKLRSRAGATHALIIGSAFVVGAIGATISMTTAASAARPLLVRDMCAGTSGGGGNMECNSAEDLLVRPKYSDGTCGEWICCPPNGDGTYNCNAGTSPSGAPLTAGLRGVAGPRATLAEPAERPARTNRAVNRSTMRARN